MTKKHILARQLSSLLTGRDMSCQIDRLQTTLLNHIPIPSSIPAAKTALRLAQPECRSAVRQARDLAKTCHDTRIIAKQLANPDKDPEQIAKTIRRREAIKKMWACIPSSKPHPSGGLCMVKIPSNPSDDPKHPDTSFRSVTDPSHIESLLLQRNRSHFSQAQGTPLASPDISESLGWGGQTEIADDLLSGSISPTLLTPDPYAQEILKKCQRVNDEIDPSISLDEMQSFYLHWNVGTSTSPSGRHLSHLHALSQPTGLPEDTPNDTSQLSNAKESLWLAHHAGVNYATRFGYCFDRWRQVVNTMIEKEPGNPSCTVSVSYISTNMIITCYWA